jgi:hypothetical protein
MKKGSLVTLAICLGIALVFALATQAVAQEKKAGKEPIRYSGRVNVMSKDAKSITIQVKSGVMQIKYTDKTAFSYRNKPGTIDDVKEGRRVIILCDASQKDLVAVRVDVREGK